MLLFCNYCALVFCIAFVALFSFFDSFQKWDTTKLLHIEQPDILELPLVQLVIIQQNTNSASVLSVLLNKVELDLFGLWFNIIGLLRLVARRFRLVASWLRLVASWLVARWRGGKLVGGEMTGNHSKGPLISFLHRLCFRRMHDKPSLFSSHYLSHNGCQADYEKLNITSKWKTIAQISCSWNNILWTLTISCGPLL